MSFNDQVIEEFRANGGKVGGHFANMELLLITTTGAKSGNPHTAPVAFTRDGEDYVIIASYGGSDKNPAWYHNLVAHPDVTVEVGAEKFAAKATITEPAERDRLYTSHSAKYPQFLDYKKKTSREIPVIVLKRQ